MAALFSTGLETTPSFDFRGAESSPREAGIRLVAMLLGISVLLLLAGWILLKTASGLQPGDAVPGAWLEGVDAPQDPAHVRPASAFGAALFPVLLPPARIADQEQALLDASVAVEASRDDRPASFLHALARRPGHVKTREQLMNEGYPHDTFVSDRTIDSHIKRIRKKFVAVDDRFDGIETVYGLGYRYTEEPG